MTRWFIGFICVLWASFVAAQTPLPVGPAPMALTFDHFPDRLHAFVWRNWNLVPTERLAEVVGAKTDEIRQVAAAMGLPKEDVLPAAGRDRLYLTIIRRNWHLLPYDQLLQLLGWTPERLDEALREDDFLWHKLGALKPKCDRLSYAPPDEAARRREAEIAKVVAEVFGPELTKPAERPLDFLGRFTGPIEHPRPVAPSANLRFLYSYFAVFGDPLVDPALDPYPDALLQKYADLGVNGVWLHVVLRDLAPASADYTEFGQGSERRLANLRALVARAKRFGIGVYLYVNEPRAMPVAFFKDRPDDAGVREGDLEAMCTSSPRVRRWLSASLEAVFRAVPDLGGVFTITGSENLTNCASHHHAEQCPRCKSRPPAEIVAEVNACIEAGVHRGSPSARVLAWDWGWADARANDVIAKLPKGVELMSVSEWGLPIHRGGVADAVGEYSLSAVGPGQRAIGRWKLARERGLATVAKVQVNNSWELSTVPYLPVMDLVAEHCHGLAQRSVGGVMLSWSLGGFPSPNLRIVQEVFKEPAAPVDAVLDRLAVERFGTAGAPAARRAWATFSNGLREYPFDASVIYRCPVQLGPANLLWAKPTGYASTMVGFPYDDLKGWRGPYPAEPFASQFEKVAEAWDAGCKELAAAVAAAPADRAEDAKAELRFARAASLHFRSVANQTRFVIARDALASGRGDRSAAAAEMRRMLREEESAAVELFRLCREDSRIGFEASNHYAYLPQDLIEKVLNCRWVGEHVAGSTK